MTQIKVEDTTGTAVAGANVNLTIETLMPIPTLFINTALGPKVTKSGKTDDKGLWDAGDISNQHAMTIEVRKGLLYYEKWYDFGIPTFGPNPSIPKILTVVVVKQPLAAIVTSAEDLTTKTVNWFTGNLWTIVIALIALVVGLAIIKYFWGTIKSIFSKTKGKIAQVKELLY
jgi:hypothetical protein